MRVDSSSSCQNLLFPFLTKTIALVLEHWNCLAISESGNRKHGLHQFSEMVSTMKGQIVLCYKLHKLSFGAEYLHFCSSCLSLGAFATQHSPNPKASNLVIFLVDSTALLCPVLLKCLRTLYAPPCVTLKDALHCLQCAISLLSFPGSTLPWYVLVSLLYSTSNSSDSHDKENEHNRFVFLAEGCSDVERERLDAIHLTASTAICS